MARVERPGPWWKYLWKFGKATVLLAPVTAAMLAVGFIRSDLWPICCGCVVLGSEIANFTFIALTYRDRVASYSRWVKQDAEINVRLRDSMSQMRIPEHEQDQVIAALDNDDPETAARITLRYAQRRRDG